MAAVVLVGTARNDEALAAALGLSSTMVRKMKKHAAWKFTAPYDVAAVREWRKVHLLRDRQGEGKARPKIDEQELAERIGRLPADVVNLERPADFLPDQQIVAAYQRSLTIRQEREVKRGKLIDAETIQREWTGIVTAAKAAFLQLPRALSGQLVGRPAREIERVLDERVRAILGGLAGERSGRSTSKKKPARRAARSGSK